MGFYQQEEILRLQITLKKTETAREQIWTIAPGEVVPDVRVRSEREPMIAVSRRDQNLFPSSALRELRSRKESYQVVRLSETKIVLSQLQKKQYVPCASHQHSSALSALAISADGSLVAFTDDTYAFSIWNWRQQQLEILPWRYPQRVPHLVFSDEHSLLAVFEKHMIGVWDVREKRVRFLLNHNRPVRSLEIHPAGHSFLTVSDDPFVRIWSCVKAEQPYVLRHLVPVQKALFSPTGGSILTMGADFVVRIWDATTGHPLAEARDTMPNCV